MDVAWMMYNWDDVGVHRDVVLAWEFPNAI